MWHYRHLSFKPPTRIVTECLHYHCSVEDAEKNFQDGICPHREIQDENDKDEGRSLFGFGKDW